MYQGDKGIDSKHLCLPRETKETKAWLNARTQANQRHSRVCFFGIEHVRMGAHSHVQFKVLKAPLSLVG